MGAPASDIELEEALSRPSEEAASALAACPGEVVILGAGGKMGPSLCRMARRACEMAGDHRRIFAVSRFSDESVATSLRDAGIEVIRADLGDPTVFARLPDARSIFFLAGQKFGTSGAPGATWMSNVVLPSQAASRYGDARIVAFSTGNVYPLVPVASGGARETDPPAPVGEYAWSCLGRERVFAHAADRRGTRVTLLRLNYAVDLRYGVLVDIARRVARGEPVDLSMGSVNCIWQGDANAYAIASLAHATSPPYTLNVAGRATLSVRAVASEFARRFGVTATFRNTEAPDALLSNTERLQHDYAAPRVTESVLIEWVAEWVQRGGSTLGKPTHFEQREGRF